MQACIPISEHLSCTIGAAVSFQKEAGQPGDVHAAYLLRHCDSLVVRAICVSGFKIYRGKFPGVA